MRILGIALAAILLTSTAWGQSIWQAKDFSAIKMDGSTVELNALKGKVVLMTFWTTRCGICHAEIPRLNRLAATYAGRDVVFLAPTTESEEKVLSYTRRYPFNFDILPNSFGLLLKYAQRDRNGNLDMGYPAYFLIDKTGAIDVRVNGWNNVGRLDSAINKLLAKN